MIPADKRIERLTQVARMYYEQNMNQSEIAKAIGVSRPLVSELLAEARECGIVTITINRVESARVLRARWLVARFGLRLAVVVEDAKSAEDTNNLVAARAAHAHFTERTGAFELMPFVTDAVKQETMNHIRIFGSEGRA